MQLPSLLILSILLNQLSLLTLFLTNEKMKTKVMRQGPYTAYDSLFRETQKKQILYALILFLAESSIVVLSGHMKELSMVSSGMLLLAHLEGINTRTQSISVKLLGVLSGFAMVCLQEIIAGDTFLRRWSNLLLYYCACVLVIECNQFIVPCIKIRKSRNSRLSPKDSFVSR